MLRLLQNEARKIGYYIAIHAVSFEIDVDAFTQTQLDVPIHAVNADSVFLESIQSHRDVPVDTVEFGRARGLGNFNATIDSVNFDRTVNLSYIYRAVDSLGNQRDLTRES